MKLLWFALACALASAGCGGDSAAKPRAPKEVAPGVPVIPGDAQKNSADYKAAAKPEKK